MNDSSLHLIAVAGPRGAGKNTFIACFQNLYLRGLPLFSIAEGLKRQVSFSSLLDFEDANLVTYLEKARKLGYQITLYYLLVGETLGRLRHENKMLLRHFVSNNNDQKSGKYQKNIDSLLVLYNYFDLIFLLENEKELRFLSAYEPNKTQLDTFKRHLKENVARLNALKI